MGQHIPQVLVHRIQIYRQELGIEVVAVILTQKLLKPFPALSPVYGIAHAGGQQLHRVIPQLCDLMGPVIQINGIAHMIGRDCRIVRSPLPECATGRSVVLVVEDTILGFWMENVLYLFTQTGSIPQLRSINPQISLFPIFKSNGITIFPSRKDQVFL